MARPKTKFEIDVPEKWEDVTLELFLKLQALYKEDNKPTFIEILSVLSNKTKEELQQYPAFIIELIQDKLTFLSTDISNEILNYVEIDGERYTINHLEELKFGEYVDVQTVIDSDKTNYPAILAILARKEGEIYNDDFIAKELDKRIDMFNKQPITKVYPTISFFLNLYLTSVQVIQSYSENLKEQANHILTAIEDSQRNGDGKRHFMNSPMKKLKKLRKQLNAI